MNNYLYTKYFTADQTFTLFYDHTSTKDFTPVISNDFLLNNVPDFLDSCCFPSLLTTQPTILTSPFMYPTPHSTPSPSSNNFLTASQDDLDAPVPVSLSNRSSISLDTMPEEQPVLCSKPYTSQPQAFTTNEAQLPAVNKKRVSLKMKLSEKVTKQPAISKTGSFGVDQVLKEKPKAYSCEHCKRSFARQYDVARHSRIHTGAKPYVCPCCLKSFARSDARIRHFRTEINCRDGAKTIRAYKNSKPRPNLSL